MNKINKIFLLYQLIFIIIFIFIPISHAQSFKDPYVHGYVFGDNQKDITAVITWGAKDAYEDGYRIQKQYKNEIRTAAVYNPKTLGDDPGTGGIYYDSAVLINEKYTYIINIFDRAGNESELGRIDLKMTTGQIKFSSLKGQIDNQGKVKLSWEDLPESDAFQIYRDEKFLAETDKNYFTDEKAITGRHQYEVKAMTGDKTSKRTNSFFPVTLASSQKQIASSVIAFNVPQNKKPIYLNYIALILGLIILVIVIGLIFIKKHAQKNSN